MSELQALKIEFGMSLRGAWKAAPLLLLVTTLCRGSDSASGNPTDSPLSCKALTLEIPAEGSNSFFSIAAADLASKNERTKQKCARHLKGLRKTGAVELSSLKKLLVNMQGCKSKDSYKSSESPTLSALEKMIENVESNLRTAALLTSGDTLRQVCAGDVAQFSTITLTSKHGLDASQLVANPAFHAPALAIHEPTGTAPAKPAPTDSTSDNSEELKVSKNCHPAYCFLTTEQALSGTTCKDAGTPDAIVRQFSLKGCKRVDDLSPMQYLNAGNNNNDTLYTADRLLIGYSPESTFLARADKAVLRIEYCREPDKEVSPDMTPQLQIKAGVAPQNDNRFKVNIYTGYAFLHTGDSFSKGYPEVLASAEERLYDGFLRCYFNKSGCWDGLDRDEQGNIRTPFSILRMYQEAGWTATTSVAKNNATTSTQDSGVVEGTKTFMGSFGLAGGYSFPVASRSEDTRAFSVQIIGRVGIMATPNSNSLPGAAYHNHSFGIRIENETGRFSGFYIEMGFGQSDQFSYRRIGRVITDTFLPINEPGSFRLALRMQSNVVLRRSGDRDLPLIQDPGKPAGVYYDAATARRITDAGEIKLTLLVSTDIFRLAKWLGGFKLKD